MAAKKPILWYLLLDVKMLGRNRTQRDDSNEYKIMIFGRFVVEIWTSEVSPRKVHILMEFTRVPTFMQIAIKQLTSPELRQAVSSYTMPSLMGLFCPACPHDIFSLNYSVISVPSFNIYHFHLFHILEPCILPTASTSCSYKTGSFSTISCSCL